MTDDQHGEGTPRSGGRWDPLPQGDYDDGATAFVRLPEGGIDALLSGDSPLAAPGHGYVPPRITATHADGTPDGWPAPEGGAHWPDPNATPAPPQATDDRFTYRPGATQHWTFEEPAAPAAPGHDVTGQWSIPVAGGDLPDESGEFTTSSLVEQWGGTPPATLPGGAPAPWATDGADHPWDGPPAGAATAPAPDAYVPEDGFAREDGYVPDDAYVPEDGYVPDDVYVPEDGYVPENGYVRQEGHLRQDGYGHGPAGHAEDGRGEAGHGDFAPEEAGHAEDGHVDGDPGDGGHPDGGPAEAGRADAGVDDDPHGGTAAQAAPDAALPPAEPAAVPETEAHGLAEAPERPGDAPAGQEEPADPATAPQPATAAATAAPLDADASASYPADPEDPATPRPAADAQASGSPAEETGPESPEASAQDAREATDAQEDRAAQDAAPDDAGEPAAVPLPPHDDHPLASYVLRVNGADRPVTDAWIGESLLYVLRERLGLAGAKDGCSQGECGACNVQVDGRLVASCLVPAVTAAGSEVRTVEGLATDGQPSDVQRALARCGAVQCGFCVPGIAMTVHDLLERNPAPTELETRQALCGNLCRCSGYRGVLEAVKEVVAERDGSPAGPGTDGDEARIPHQAGPGSGGVHPSAFEAPGAFGSPPAPPAPPVFEATPDGYGDAPDGYGDPQDAYGDAPDAYGDPQDAYGDTPDAYGVPGPRDQHYGQDGGLG
ncbi:2Fe-2S iron-sulfur cluster-binding protein [Streptomyces sp. NPDC014991]|uniref:2Fe-2S iron-sulfur cluster-binding protein n=1 Tax=Streptomyces sp. NPDC014991 TaxID=3364935 RepID=UPI0036F6CBD5